jgi:hypothetical protein
MFITCTLLLPEGQMGETRGPSKKQSYLENRAALDRNVLSLFGALYTLYILSNLFIDSSVHANKTECTASCSVYTALNRGLVRLRQCKVRIQPITWHKGTDDGRVTALSLFYPQRWMEVVGLSHVPTTARSGPSHVPATVRSVPNRAPTTVRSGPSHVPTTVRSGPSHVPTTVRSGKYFDILRNETGSAFRSVSKGSEKFAPIRIRTPKHPARRQSLCRLRYCSWLIKRAHWNRYSYKDQDNRHRTELFS